MGLGYIRITTNRSHQVGRYHQHKSNDMGLTKSQLTQDRAPQFMDKLGDIMYSHDPKGIQKTQSKRIQIVKACQENIRTDISREKGKQNKAQYRYVVSKQEASPKQTIYNLYQFKRRVGNVQERDVKLMTIVTSLCWKVNMYAIKGWEVA